jgi:amino acid transporter
VSSLERPAVTSGTLRRTLSFRDLVVYGLLFIGPLAPVAVFGVLDARTSGAVALVYLLATVAMAFTAWSYAEMSRVVPHAGSVFAYASEGLGRHAGFLAGWLAMLDYLLIPSVAYLFCGIALHALVPSVPAWLFTVLAFVVMTLLNLTGVKVAANAGSVMLAVEILVLILFVAAALVVLARHGPARPWLTPFTGVELAVLDSQASSGGSPGATVGFGAGLAAIVGAISIAVLSFLGFDAIASFAEETAGDPRAVGRAILVCLAASGLVFVLQTYLAAALSPVAPQSLVANPERQGTAFYDITRVAIGPWLSTVLAATKAVGPAFAAMTAQAAAARLLFGMARDGHLPRALANVDALHGVPRAALMTTGAFTLLVSVWAARRSDGLDVLVSIVDIGALAAFTLLHASVIGFFVFKADRRATTLVAAHTRSASHIVVPILGAVVTVWVIAEASRAAKLVGLVWTITGVIAGFFLRSRVAIDSSATSHERAGS